MAWAVSCCLLIPSSVLAFKGVNYLCGIVMTLKELQEQALKLTSEERWQLITELMRSIRPSSEATTKPKGLAASLVGIAKTDASPPTDEEIKSMLDER